MAGGGWRPLQPSGKSQSQTGNGSFCVALTVPTRIESPPKLCGRLTLAGVPENAPLPFDSPLTPSSSLDSIRLPLDSPLRKCVDDFH